MIRRLALALAALTGVAGIGFAGFVFAVEHPSTRGPVRCWLQEQVYTRSWQAAPPSTPVVEATLVTQPVRDPCDAADDPAIVIAEDKVWVLGTNKQRSLNVYDAKGVLMARADNLGAPNNVDTREYKDQWVVIASDKDGGEVEAFSLNPATGALTALQGAPYPAQTEDELYGLCLYRRGDALFVFTTDKSGLIVQYRFDAFTRLTKVRTLRVATQPEACVVDDSNAAVFVGEEDVGIWRFDADPKGPINGTLIAGVRPAGELVADIEGLAVYEGSTPDQGYLIASSQGDNTYAVFARRAPHTFMGRFQIARGGELIGDTDGLDVISVPVGSAFPNGLLVVQDGFIRTGGLEGAQSLAGARRKQRFAFVSWSTVEDALELQTLPARHGGDHVPRRLKEKGW